MAVFPKRALAESRDVAQLFSTIDVAAISDPNSPDESPMSVRLGLLFNHRLDAELSASALKSFDGVTVQLTEIHPTPLKRACLAGSFDAVIAECPLKEACSFELASELLTTRLVQSVMLLDREFCVTRAHRALQTPGVGYLSRNCTIERLVRSLYELLKGGIVVDPAAEPSDVSSRPAAQKSLLRVDRHGLLSLTTRERQVMQLLAQGLSVIDAARVLGVAVSTIDNHRTRLKKKLNLRRSVEIARLAVREGIVADI